MSRRMNGKATESKRECSDMGLQGDINSQYFPLHKKGMHIPILAQLPEQLVVTCPAVPTVELKLVMYINKADGPASHFNRFIDTPSEERRDKCLLIYSVLKNSQI